MILDGDGVLEGAVDVALVALALLVLDLHREPVGGHGGEHLHQRQRR